jgi:hypothetical protein
MRKMPYRPVASNAFLKHTPDHGGFKIYIIINDDL